MSDLNIGDNPLDGATVVLLEDEFLVAVDAEEMLTRQGAKVLLASNLDTARRLALEADADIAVLDVNINGAYSFPIAQLFRDRGVPVIFASGYELKGRGFPGAELGICIGKPYTHERLRDVIIAALTEARDTASAAKHSGDQPSTT
jgi:DNA-binding response OmpR family regulator